MKADESAHEGSFIAGHTPADDSAAVVAPLQEEKQILVSDDVVDREVAPDRILVVRLRAGNGSHGGNANTEPRATAGSVLRHHRSPVGLGDGLHDGQPETRAFH